MFLSRENEDAVYIERLLSHFPSRGEAEFASDNSVGKVFRSQLRLSRLQRAIVRAPWSAVCDLRRGRRLLHLWHPKDLDSGRRADVQCGQNIRSAVNAMIGMRRMETVDRWSSPMPKSRYFGRSSRDATTSIHVASKAGEPGNPDMLRHAGTSGSPAFAKNRESVRRLSAPPFPERRR
jgi:hypothetical protein